VTYKFHLTPLVPQLSELFGVELKYLPKANDNQIVYEKQIKCKNQFFYFNDTFITCVTNFQFKIKEEGNLCA